MNEEGRVRDKSAQMERERSATDSSIRRMSISSHIEWKRRGRGIERGRGRKREKRGER